MYQELFQQHMEEYQRLLKDPLQPLWLQKITGIHAQLGVVTDNNKSGWSDTLQNLIVSLLTLLGVAAVVVAMLAIRHGRKQRLYRRKQQRYQQQPHDDYQDEYSFSQEPEQQQQLRLTASQDGDASFVSASTLTSNRRPTPISTRVSSLDSARHGRDVFHPTPQMNAMSALEASDRYLSKHRPDLYETDSSHDLNIFGRSYQIPSNPFEWLYANNNNNNGQASAAHFPFVTPSHDALTRHAFATPSPSGTSTPTSSAFTPVTHAQPNLAARYMDRPHPTGSDERRASATRHTGQNWQYDDDDDQRTTASSLVGSIFRNLSMTSWASSAANDNNHQGQYPTAADFQHNDPSLLNPDMEGDIELEELQDDDNDYEFAFKDFPRVDGTPCLIYKDNEDELKERERRRIFHDDNSNSSHTDTESKQDDAKAKPVSDRAFMRMLSENSLAIDEEDDEFVMGSPAGGMQEEETSAKSPRFQQQLARLLETKQRRYAMEYKKEAIVKEQRQKRKHIREQQRVERHMAMERDLEEIEAEFLSPLARDMQEKLQQQSQLHPPLSPNPPPKTRHGGSGSWNVPSPGRNKGSAASPASRYGTSVRPKGHERVSSLGANPFRRRNLGRNGSFSNAIGQTHNSVGGAPSPGTGRSNHQRSGSSGNAILRSASHDVADRVSPQGSLNSSQHGGSNSDHRFKVRPVNMYERDIFGHSSKGGTLPPSDLDNLSVPAMNGNQKYPSPQSVVDEILQQSTRHTKSATHGNGRQPHTFNHRRTRTPTKQSIPPTGSFEVVDFGLNPFSKPPAQRSPLKRSSSSHRRSQSSSMGGGGGGGSSTGSRDGRSMSGGSAHGSSRSHHQRSSSQHSLGGRHRRSNSQSSHHRRSNSQQPTEDIFLHGVVAQTRFV
jgi:hypothetical protein